MNYLNQKFISDIHDFTHVLSGYPPDPVGELLRIEYGKDFEGNGWKVLSRVGKMRIFFNGIKEWYSCRPLYKEARQMGKMSKNYIFADWFNILGEDINKVRENLNTHPTTKYHWKIAQKSRTSSFKSDKIVQLISPSRTKSNAKALSVSP